MLVLAQTMGAFVSMANHTAPFTAAADFMSRAGFLRLMIHMHLGQWIPWHEAVRLVNR